MYLIQMNQTWLHILPASLRGHGTVSLAGSIHFAGFLIWVLDPCACLRARLFRKAALRSGRTRAPETGVTKCWYGWLQGQAWSWAPLRRNQMPKDKEI